MSAVGHGNRTLWIAFGANLGTVDFEDHMSAREVERLVCQIEDETAARFPDVDRLYIRPCSAADRDVA